MKVGDYVRTKNGLIGKIIFLDEEKVKMDLIEIISYRNYNDIIKSSPNIIDLIEVGDYVNGIRVDEIKNRQLRTSSYYDGYICNLCSDYEIKSIVTKEQFERMEYKVGE